MRVDNAIIMAAGTSSRFAPLSYERHKGLTVVLGEVLIERQIRQLLEADITEIHVVTGYKAEQFDYLKKMYGVQLIYNPDYQLRNNNASIWAARHVLRNSYICSADNYFEENLFSADVEGGAYYAAQWSDGKTEEWCISEDADGYIDSVVVGGMNSWYMMGHAFWDESFSGKFLSILKKEYYLPETSGKLWESIFMAHLDILKMRIQKFPNGRIREFDSLDELRVFDPSYISDTHSETLKTIAGRLGVAESALMHFDPIKEDEAEAVGFSFDCNGARFEYRYKRSSLTQVHS